MKAYSGPPIPASCGSASKRVLLLDGGNGTWRISWRIFGRKTEQWQHREVDEAGATRFAVRHGLVQP